MRIPRYQFTSGTQMPQSRPVLRDQPTMRSPVTRNVNAYLSDPRAGQRDMNLEVAAAGRGKYVATALSKGLTDLGLLLARADAEEQYLNAAAEFKIEIGANLSVMKTQKLSEPVNRVFNGNIEEHMEGVYTKSAATFNKWIIQRRDFIAKGLGREARSAFLRSSVATVAGAQSQAAGYARQQHIGWLHGRAWKLIKQAPDHGALTELEQSDLFRTAMGDQPFAKAILDRRIELDLDWWRLMVSTSGLTGLRELGLLIRNRGIEQLGGEGGKEASQQYRRHHAGRYLQGEHWDIIRDWAKDRRDTIIADRKFKQDQFLDDKIIDVLKNPGNYNLDTFKELAMSDPQGRGFAWVDNDGFNTLVQLWDSIRNVTLVSSDPNTLMDVRMNIEDWDIGRISKNKDLTIADRLAGIEKRLAFDKGVRDWDSKDNPVSDLGWRAVRKLERHYGLTIGGVTPIIKFRNINAQEKEFKDAYDALELLMMDPELPDELKPKAAWDHVAKIIADDLNKKPNGDTGSAASAETYKILGLTGKSIEIGKFNKWEREYGPIKSVFEKADIEALKALRDDLGIIVTATMLLEFGVSLDIDELTIEKGSLEAAYDWLGNILFFWRND